VDPFDTVKEIAAGTNLVKTAPDVKVEDLKSMVHGFSVTVSALELTDAEMLDKFLYGMFAEPSKAYDQLAAVVPLVRTQVNVTVACDGMSIIALSPLD
jgi:hypothetical protein